VQLKEYNRLRKKADPLALKPCPEGNLFTFFCLFPVFSGRDGLNSKQFQFAPCMPPLSTQAPTLELISTCKLQAPFFNAGY
jgi:hypothetical protein